VASGQAIRRHNLALALRLIGISKEPLSRADLAAAGGMTRATAGSLVDQLIAGGLLLELPRASASAAGRPATGLRLDGRGFHGLGLEVNVDYLGATLLDAAGRVRYREVLTQDQRGVPPVEVLARLGRLAGRASAAAGTSPVAGAAIAVPGLVDAGSGLVRSAPNLDWVEVEALEVLGKLPALAGIPLHLGNEANYSALAELAGTRPPDGDFLLISGEIGIGAGIVVAGDLLTGRHGWGGELGHITVDPAGARCGCGSHGCLETYAGQEAILRAAGAAVPTATILGPTPTLGWIIERARKGDPATLEAIRVATVALGIVVAGVLNVLDIATVVLGGIYAPLAPWMSPVLNAELQDRVIWSAWLAPTVTVSTLRPGAACLGAATSVVRAVINDPWVWMNRPQARKTPAH